MRIYDYHLDDDSGSSLAEEQAILIPIGTKFLHEYGLYQVGHYRNQVGEVTRKQDEIYTVHCDRIKSNNQLKNERKKNGKAK